MLAGIVIIIVVAVSILIYNAFKAQWQDRWKEPEVSFPIEWKQVLLEYVEFYEYLNVEDRALFEYKIQEFLLNCQVVGKDIEVIDQDRVLVAASAIIPVFRITSWRYTNLYEVHLVSNAFDFHLNTKGPNRSVLGMVGNGDLEGKMVLSKKALYLGFINNTDKKNTAIHEFVHLIDKKDGKIDGIPKVLLDEVNIIPWMELVASKMSEINNDDSDINDYGGTSEIEFFTVTSEYFFERPRLLRRKHTELYTMLEEIYRQKMTHHGLKEK
jgi:Mlc titration factor MtfA (ptsG expression regulator)